MMVKFSPARYHESVLHIGMKQVTPAQCPDWQEHVRYFMFFIEQVKTTCGHLFFLIRLNMSDAALDSFISLTSVIWDTGCVVSCVLGEGGYPGPIFSDKIPQRTSSIFQLQTTRLIINSEARCHICVFSLWTLQAHMASGFCQLSLTVLGSLLHN